jgi:hypothetical protein
MFLSIEDLETVRERYAKRGWQKFETAEVLIDRADYIIEENRALTRV